MSEKDKNVTPENNQTPDATVPEPPKPVPASVPNVPANAPKEVTISELDAIGKQEDWEKRWKVQTGGSGGTWKVSKTYTTYKDLLIQFLQSAVSLKTTVGLKRKAARKFLQYSNKVASQFEAIKKKKPLDGVSVSVAVAKKNLEIAKSTIENIKSDIKKFEEQKKLCDDYASRTTLDAMSANPSIARKKSLGRGWLPENHRNETLEQIEKGKGAGVGGSTKDKYKIDILNILGIDVNQNSNAILFDGFDKRQITLSGLSNFFVGRSGAFESAKGEAEKALKQAEITKAYKEKELFEAEEDIKLAKKQMSGDFNNRVRKAFRLGNEVLNGNLFNLLISDDWIPLDGQQRSEYSKTKSVSALSKVFDATLGKLSDFWKKTKKDVENDSNKELKESIVEGKEDVEDWKHLSNLWPAYIVLDKLMTANYVVALLAQGSLDSQTFHIKKIDKSLKPSQIIFLFLDARAKNAQSKMKELETADEIEHYLVSQGLSPSKGPFLVETHKKTGKPVLSPSAISNGKLDKKVVQEINDRLGLTSIAEEDKEAKEAKSKK